MGDNTQSDTGAQNSTTATGTFTKSGAFGVTRAQAKYPSGKIVFGLESAQNDYIVSMARFTFYNAFGNKIPQNPELYIRMGGAFNSSLINSYSPVSGTFGQPSELGGGSITDEVKAMFDKLSESAIGAIQKQVLEAVVGTAGFLSSAGLNAKTQIEFLTRKMVNNFNQLVYQGPNYRRFQLPFNMKPTSPQEASYMREIIQVFRTASSPKTGNDVVVEAPSEDPGDINKLSGDAHAAAAVLNDPKSSAEAKQNAEAQLKAYNDSLIQSHNRGAYELAKATDVLTFGYPDMCRFELLLVDGTTKDPLEILFKSDFCVIDSVSVDYGSGNKLTFFKDRNPAEVNLTISLQEINFVTAGDATNYEKYKIQ